MKKCKNILTEEEEDKIRIKELQNEIINLEQKWTPEEREPSSQKEIIRWLLYWLEKMYEVSRKQPQFFGDDKQKLRGVFHEIYMRIIKSKCFFCTNKNPEHML